MLYFTCLYFLKECEFYCFYTFLAGNSINNKHIQYGEM